MEESLTLRYNLGTLGVSVLGFALTLAFTFSDPGSTHWAPISVMLLAGLSLGYQEARAILEAKDELLDAILKKEIRTILRKHSQNRRLFVCVRIVAIGAYIAGFMYLDMSLRGAFPAFFAFVSGFHAIRLPSIVKLDRYARSQIARSAT